jgi:hypothetical protein
MWLWWELTVSIVWEGLLPCSAAFDADIKTADLHALTFMGPLVLIECNFMVPGQDFDPSRADPSLQRANAGIAPMAAEPEGVIDTLQGLVRLFCIA